MAERDNICKQIHMPLQAGNDRVLHKMNRTYSKEEFLSLSSQIKEIIPNIALSTDIIIGFPTETEEEFQDTLDVVREVEFDSAFNFKYSERPNTRAAMKFPDNVTEEEKKDRITRLNDLQNEICLIKNQAHIGETMDILIEQLTTKRSDKDVQGRADNNKIVIIPNNDYKIGDWVTVKITEATRNILRAIPQS